MSALGISFLALLLASANALDCFKYDTDYDGTNLNNGIEQKVDSAEECQRLCKSNPNCEGFTWSNNNFPDEYYRNACWLKTNIIDQYYRKDAVSGPPTCNVDPTEPPNPGDCCQRINFGSTGNLIGSEQAHILGSYQKSLDGESGTWIYEQYNGRGNKLWYLGRLNAWFIGDDPGTNVGYAIGFGDSKCPEDLPRTWQWWNFSNDQWVIDEAAKYSCE